MRRIFPLVLAGVLALTVGAPLAAEWGRLHLERQLSRFFRIPVRVQKLSFSPTRVTLHRVSLGTSAASLISLERLQISGFLPLLLGRPVHRMESVALTGLSVSLAGLPLRAQGRLFFTPASDPGDPRCEGWLMLEHPFLKGRVEVSGSVREPVFLGWIQGPRGGRHFVGQLEFSPEEVRLSRLDIQDGVTVSGRLMKGTPEGGRLLLQLHPEEQARLSLEIAWERISRSGLKIRSRTPDGQVSMEGRWDPRATEPVQAKLEFQEASLSDLATWVLSEKDRPRLEGWVRGRVELTGSPDRLASRGELFAKEVRFNAARFDGLTLRFHGTGPWLRVQDSQMAGPDGTLRMEGLVDLRRMGEPTFFKEVRLTSADKTLNWDGWKLAPLGSGLQVQRRIAGDRVEVGFNYEVDSQVPPEPVQREGVEVGVPIAPDKRLNVRMDREGEFFGVEHRKQF